MGSYGPRGAVTALRPSQAFDWALEAWGDGLTESPRLALLLGEPGMGKSRLLRKLAGRLGAAAASASGPPLLPNLLRGASGMLIDETDPSFLAAARHLLPSGPWAGTVIEAGAPSSREELTRSLTHAFSRVAWRRSGACLLLDDVHDWSSDDRDALRILYLRALAAQAPLMIVLAGRPGPIEEWWSSFAGELRTAGAPPVLQARLEPLDEEAIELLVEEVLRTRHLPEALPQWLLARAGGNPLHTVELVRFLVEGGALENIGPAWQFHSPSDSVLPEGLEAVLDARLHQVRHDPELWPVLASLAIMGRPAQLGEWSSVAAVAEEQLVELGGEAARLGLIRLELTGGKERYSLAHPLYPPRVRAMLSRTERRKLHAAAVDAIVDPGERARHARLAGDHRGAELTWQALEEARRRFAFDELIAHAEALLPQAGEDRSRLLLFLGEARFYRGDLARAVDTLGTSDEPEAAVLRAEALKRLGRLEEALALVQERSAREEGAVKGRLEVIEVSLQLQLGSEAGVRGLEQMLDRAAEGSHARASMLLERGRQLHKAGRFHEALLVTEEALPAFRKAGDSLELARALNNVGIYASQLGLWGRSEEALLESIEISEARGDRANMASRRLNLGSLHLRRGEYGRAQEAYQYALRLASSSGDREVATSAQLSLGELSSLTGDLRRSEEFYRQGIVGLEEMGRSELAEPWRAALLLVKALTDSATAVLPELMSLSERVRHPNLPLLVGEAFLLAHSPAEAARFLEAVDLSSLRPTLAAQYLLGRSLARALLADLEQAEAELASAQVIVAGEQHEGLVGQAAMQGAVLAELRGDGSEARRLARIGHENLQRCGAWGHLAVLERVYPRARRLREDAATELVHATKGGAFLRTLGRFELELDGKVLAWRARKVRELLALLLVALMREGGPWVHRTSLITDLWPESEPGKADASFRATVKRLRIALGDAATVERSPEGEYRIDLRRSDVTLFSKAIESGQFELAVSWYGGPFLPGIDLPGVDPLRDRLRGHFAAAARRLASSLPASRAVELYQRLLDDDPYDLPTLLGLLDSLEACKSHGRAQRTLREAARKFETELGSIPAELLPRLEGAEDMSAR